jgi:hypothetical protein
MTVSTDLRERRKDNRRSGGEDNPKRTGLRGDGGAEPPKCAKKKKEKKERRKHTQATPLLLGRVRGLKPPLPGQRPGEPEEQSPKTPPSPAGACPAGVAQAGGDY